MEKTRVGIGFATLCIILSAWACKEAELPPPLASDRDGFVLVEGGAFTMGDRYGNRDETSLTPVSVSAFLIAPRELTRGEWAAFLKAGGRPATAKGDERLPADGLSWREALEYCNWLSAERGLEPVYSIGPDSVEADWEASGYRLPSEAEWEFAARGGLRTRKRAMPGGNDPDSLGWHNGNASGPAPVGGKRPNELGLLDMSGNVWEWCWDSYGMYDGRPKEDPRGPAWSEWKVLRGGSWRFDPQDMRSANRYFADWEEGPDDAGLRLARSVVLDDDRKLLARALERLNSGKASAAKDGSGKPPADAPYRDPSRPTAERVRDLLSRMSLEEKAGQTTQAALDYLGDYGAVERRFLGSVLSGGGMGPVRKEAGAWADMTDALQKAALSTRLGIPLIYGIDAVHGHNNVRGAVIYPHNIGLGAAGDEDLVERIGAATARDLLATGTRWNFAPCLAVPRDERWGRSYEGFSEDPGLVARLGAAYVRGLQGEKLGRDSVAATAKHYLADGGTTGGKDRGDARGDDKSLRSIFLPPYRAALAESAASVMASFSSWNGEPMHSNKALLTGLLKGELGFSGVVISDWGALKLLPKSSLPEQVLAAMDAGIDMVMVPDTFSEHIDALINLVDSGKLPEKRLDDAVARILRMKFEMGLFEDPWARRGLLAGVGSAEQRALGREAVRRSLVLLKNEGRALPLKGQAGRLLVAGKAADDIGIQCGGWTITWQGSPGPITPGTTILAGLRGAAAAKGMRVDYEASGNFDDPGTATVVLVLGERPYAEMVGDRQDLSLSDEERALARRLAALPGPLVIVLISGRPMTVTAEIGLADAFVAAWLPGTEGAGVADVLFGDYPPQGRLPYTWPRDISQLPINAGDGKVGLYPLGYGLGY
jgi:beta-glucosidase